MDEGLTGMNVASRESSPATTPHAASDTSRGSSVSSDLQREYEDILRYAIVTPKFDTALPNVYQSNIDGTESKRLSTLSTIAEVSMPDRSRSKCETSEKEEEESESASEVDERGVKHAVAIGRMAQSAQKEVIAEASKDNQKQEKREKCLIWTERGDVFPFNGKVGDEFFSSKSSSPSTTFTENYEDRIDDDLLRMENLMDAWCLELKRNVLGEFSNSKLKQLEILKQNLALQNKRQKAEEDALSNQIGSQNELLHTFEKSIHQKDVVITNLTNALEIQKDKQEKLKILLTWKLKHNDEKRENFSSKLAAKHYQKSLLSKVWVGWRSIIEMRWKQRVERACQARSQEICIKLTEDYEERLQALQKSLETARLEIASLHSERDNYEETMKKAFMRGVCALNMEAMNMFKEKANEDGDEIAKSKIPDCQTQEIGATKASVLQESQNRSDVKSYGKNSKKTVHLKAIGKASLGSKMSRNEKSGNDACQPMITSVYVEKHNGDQKMARSSEIPKQMGLNKSRIIRQMNGKGVKQTTKVVD